MIAFRSLKSLVWALILVSLLPGCFIGAVVGVYSHDAGVAGGILTFVVVLSMLLDRVGFLDKPPG